MNRQRRAFAVAVLAAILPGSGQAQAKVYRLGVLLFSNPEADPNFAAFRAALRQLGYAEERNLRYEVRSAAGNAERLAVLAEELVQARPDAILALGGDVVPFVQKATRTIPVIMVVSNDPVQSHLVKALARPGENITGATFVLDQLAGKRIALLKEVMPRLAHASVLWDPGHADPEFREMQRAAAGLGVKLQSVEVRRSHDFDAAFDAMRKSRSEALIPVSSRLINLQRGRILQFAETERIPLAADWGEWKGALLAYGPNVPQVVARTASYVDLVLKGARPADLPVQQPTKFDLVIDLNAARRLNLHLPQAVLVRADHIID